MNNTINTYNSPTFCAKPSIIKNGPAKTIIRNGKVTFITQNNDTEKNIFRKTIERYNENGIMCYRAEHEAHVSTNFGVSAYWNFDPVTGKYLGGRPVYYRLDSRPWIVRPFSKLFSNKK